MQFIKKKRDYQNVYSSYEKHYGKLFLFLLGTSQLETPFSLGIIVSKKVGNAVHRNKVKRRVRAFVRQHTDELPPVGAGVLIARAGAGEASWDATEQDLRTLLRIDSHQRNAE